MLSIAVLFLIVQMGSNEVPINSGIDNKLMKCFWNGGGVSQRNRKFHGRSIAREGHYEKKYMRIRKST